MTWLCFGITPSFLEGAYQRMLMFQNFFERALVAVTRAHHRQPFLVALLTPVGSGDHAPFDALDHQWPFGPIADLQAPPGCRVKRLAPGLHAVPGPHGPASLPPILWERRLQITERRVRGDGQQRALVQGRQATTEPGRTSHLVIPGHPPLRERATVCRQLLPGNLVP